MKQTYQITYFHPQYMFQSPSDHHLLHRGNIVCKSFHIVPVTIFHGGQILASCCPRNWLLPVNSLVEEMFVQPLAHGYNVVYGTTIMLIYLFFQVIYFFLVVMVTEHIITSWGLFIKWYYSHRTSFFLFRNQVPYFVLSFRFLSIHSFIFFIFSSIIFVFFSTFIFYR